MLEQARNAEAAANTRPFAVNGVRLADGFPEETAQSRELLIRLLRDALADAGDGRDVTRDADAIYQLAFGRMHDALVRREPPSDAEVEHTVEFALGGARGASEASGTRAVSGPNGGIEHLGDERTEQ